MECGCLTSQLTHLRGWEQNELETGVGVARLSQLLEAVPSLQPCSPLRCPGEGRPTIRPCSHPAPLNCPAEPTEIPRTQAWPHARPNTLTSRSRPCLLWPPLRTGRGARDGRGGRSGRGSGGGAGAEHASMAQVAGGGALACSNVTDDWTRAGQEKAPNGVLPGGRGHAQLLPHSQGRNKQTLA